MSDLEKYYGEKVKVGDHRYFDASYFLSNKNNPNGSITGNKEGMIVYTKYGPQLRCLVTGVKFNGLQVKILNIDHSKKGHYSEWREFKQILKRQDISDIEKQNLLLDVLSPDL